MHKLPPRLVAFHRRPPQRGQFSMLIVIAVIASVSFGVGCSGPMAGDGDGDGDGDPQPDPTPDAGPDVETGWEPARDDRTAALGSNNTFDVATWNIENFPKTSQTAEFLADLIRSMALDVVAVQEVASISGFEELVGRLPDHDGVLTSDTYGDGSYQKTGFIYRNDLVLRDVTELFRSNWFAFPRPPLEARVILRAGTPQEREVRMIVVHLKANYQAESVERRRAAFVVLDNYVSALDEDVILLGDFNEVVTNSAGLEVFAPIADDDATYTIWSEPLANQGQATFIPFGSMIDHIITTTTLDDEVGNRSAIVPSLDDEFITYVGLGSDHLPVVLSLDL